MSDLEYLIETESWRSTPGPPRPGAPVIDAGTLFVASSSGDFPGTLLEHVIGEEKVPVWTHNPPMVIVLESDLAKRREGQNPLEATPLAAAVNAALQAEIERLRGLEGGDAR